MGSRHPCRTGIARTASRRRALLRAALVVAAAAWGWVAGAFATAAEPALQKAAALRAEGRFDEALEVLRIESREIKAADGDESPRLLPVNDLAAEILLDSGDLKTASVLLDKTIAARRKLVDAGRVEQSSPLGGSLLALARLEMAAKNPPAAVDAARRALILFGGMPDRDAEGIVRSRDALQKAVNALDAMLGSDADATREARDKAATAFVPLGMLTEAIEERKRNLSSLVSKGGVDAEAIREATVQLGQLMMMAGRADEALPIVEQSLGALGPDHPREATALRRLLGDLQLAADKLVLAEGSFALVQEAARTDGKPAPFTEAGDRLRGLLVAARRGGVDRLPDWFEPTVKSMVKPPPSDVPAAIAGLVLASRVQEALANPAAAVESLTRALALASAVKPPDAAQVADLSGRLAAAHLDSGNLPVARKTAEQALAVAERDLGPGDARVGFLRILLADALLRAGETNKAVALTLEALQPGLPRPDEAWEERATAIYDRLAAGAGRNDLREQYVAARAGQFGADHPFVALACRLFGAARLAAGDWPAAVEFVSRALDLQQASLGDEHPEVAASLVLLAHAQYMAGESKRAVETAGRGLAAWERAAGADHPGALSAADVLVAAKVRAGDTAGVVDLLERLCAPDVVRDPADRAGYLVRLADLTAARDRVRAKKFLDEALQLPCWQAAAAASPAIRLRLAFTAALAAHAFRTTGDSAAATEAVQRARQLALLQEDSKAVLDRIEQLAARGEQPAGPR